MARERTRSLTGMRKDSDQISTNLNPNFDIMAKSYPLQSTVISEFQNQAQSDIVYDGYPTVCPPIGPLNTREKSHYWQGNSHTVINNFKSSEQCTL